jgi:O-antigen/teichoic acid export membrane protein
VSLSSPYRLLNNTAWNIIGRFIAVGVSIGLTSYLVANLGTERFGLWALANLLVGYFSLADLGIQASLVRQIAFARPDENPEELSKIVSTSFFVFFGAFVVAAPAALVLAPMFKAFMPSGELAAEALLVVQVAIGSVFLSIAFAVLNSILPGVQRMDLSNQIGAMGSLALLGGSVIAIEGGWGVPGVLLASIAAKILQGWASYLVARGLFPQFRLLERHVDRAVWKELFSFGWKIQVSRLCELGTFTFDRLFLSVAAGVGALGLYQPAVQVATQARMLPFLAIQALLPYTSELSAAGQKDKLRRIYFEGSLYLSFATFALLGFLIAFAPWLTLAWLGEDFESEKVALWIRIFCLGYLFNVPLSLAGIVSQAIGRPGIQARSSLMGAGLNVILAPLGFWYAGVTGLTVGATMAVVLPSLWFAWALHRAIGVTNIEFQKKSVVAPLAHWFPAVVVGLAATSQFGPTERSTAFAFAGAAGLVWAGYGWMAARRLELFDVRARIEALDHSD